MLHLQRMGSTPWGTFGTLRLPDGSAFPTVEPRWEYNAQGKSCIPAGVYLLAQRASPIVRRTSGGEFNSGWEVTGVLNRSLIMIHPGTAIHRCSLIILMPMILAPFPDISVHIAQSPGIWL